MSRVQRVCLGVSASIAIPARCVADSIGCDGWGGRQHGERRRDRRARSICRRDRSGDQRPAYVALGLSGCGRRRHASVVAFEGEIRVVLRERAQHVELVVSDTGVGIAAADQPHVFERFFRAPNQRARSHEGPGIGLALVKELAKLHGGRVRLTSEEGRGTTVTVWIPAMGTRATAPCACQRGARPRRQRGHACLPRTIALRSRLDRRGRGRR